jgi:RNA polymerase sigma factor (sigma-70 family)
MWFRRLRVAEAGVAELPDKVWKHRLKLTKNLITSRIIPLIFFLAKDIPNNSANPLFDEVISAGQLALTRAINKFDEDKGCRFSTYAHSAISNAMINALAREGKNPRRARRVGSEELDFLEARNNAYSATSRAEMAEWAENLQWAMQHADLDATEQLVLREHFAEGKKLRQVCDEQGYSKSWASKHCRSAIAKLRLAIKDRAPTARAA